MVQWKVHGHTENADRRVVKILSYLNTKLTVLLSYFENPLSNARVPLPTRLDPPPPPLPPLICKKTKSPDVFFQPTQISGGGRGLPSEQRYHFQNVFDWVNHLSKIFLIYSSSSDWWVLEVFECMGKDWRAVINFVNLFHISNIYNSSLDKGNFEFAEKWLIVDQIY